MRIPVAFALLFSASVASAQPRPAQAKPAPAKPAAPGKPVCAPSFADKYRVAIVGTDAVGCWKEQGKPETCVAISPSGATRSVVPPSAAAAPTTAEIRDVDGKKSACAGTTCVKVGKKLGAAIGKLAAEAAKPDYVGPEATPTVSTDLKLASVGGVPWSIKGDKPLKLRPPAEYKKTKGEKPGGGMTAIVGNFATSGWSNCAGPCGMDVVIDTVGKNKGKWFPGGIPLALDDKRAAIAPSEAEGKLTVIDVKTAKQLHSVTLAEGAIEGTRAVRIDDSNLAVMWDGMDGWMMAFVSLKADQAPSVTQKSIPKCP